MVVPTPTAAPPLAAGQRMQEADDRRAEPAASRHRHEIVEVIARAEDVGRAGDEDAAHAVGCAGFLDRRRHRFIHCKRKRIFLVGPVHPDPADRSFVADHDVWHFVFHHGNRVANERPGYQVWPIAGGA
jgi:hypothetical protein